MAFDVEYLSVWCNVYLVSDGVYFFLQKYLIHKGFFSISTKFLDTEEQTLWVFGQKQLTE